MIAAMSGLPDGARRHTTRDDEGTETVRAPESAVGGAFLRDPGSSPTVATSGSVAVSPIFGRAAPMWLDTL